MFDQYSDTSNNHDQDIKTISTSLGPQFFVQNHVIQRFLQPLPGQHCLQVHDISHHDDHDHHHAGPGMSQDRMEEQEECQDPCLSGT